MILTERATLMYHRLREEHTRLLDLALKEQDAQEWGASGLLTERAAGVFFALKMLHEELGYQ